MTHLIRPWAVLLAVLAAGTGFAFESVVAIDGTVPDEPAAEAEAGGLRQPLDGDGYVYVDAGTGNNLWPWSTALGTSMRFQMLYLQSEIGQAGRMTSYAWQNGSGVQRSFRFMTVKFCHTPVSSLTTDLEANYGGRMPDTVFFSPNHRVGSGVAGGWDSVPVSWQYNNTDNLL
ncbi:hypothetical protein FJY71_01720, partial [candidate division WOR-3 bacterium]|nr:hypothetical protein [candidate division WOR-3 bacterium]